MMALILAVLMAVMTYPGQIHADNFCCVTCGDNCECEDRENCDDCVDMDDWEIELAKNLFPTFMSIHHRKMRFVKGLTA